MRILAVDTAEQSCSIALVEDEVPVCESFFRSKLTHSRSLMEMIAHMVEERAGLVINDIDGFAVAQGPGSFTGLRIGISVVKGLAYALSKPAVGISSLDGLAWQFSEGETSTVCAMMDAKRGEVYCAYYRFKNGRLLEKGPEQALTPERAAKIAEGDDNGAGLFVGSGAEVYKDAIQTVRGAKARFAPPFKNVIKASALAHALFQGAPKLSKEPNAIKPVYLRRSDAEINYEKRNSS